MSGRRRMSIAILGTDFSPPPAALLERMARITALEEEEEEEEEEGMVRAKLEQYLERALAYCVKHKIFSWL